MPSPAAVAELATELLRAGRSVELRMLGRSMRPLIEPDRLLRVDPARADDVRLGDIVLVDIGGRHVCHRLVRIGGDYVVTRGDANAFYDPPQPREAIVGRVPIPPSPLAVVCALRALLRR